MYLAAIQRHRGDDAVRGAPSCYVVLDICVKSQEAYQKDPKECKDLESKREAQGGWFALSDGARVPVGPRWAVLSVAELGTLGLVSKQLTACNPGTAKNG